MYPPGPNEDTESVWIVFDASELLCHNRRVHPGPASAPGMRPGFSLFRRLIQAVAFAVVRAERRLLFSQCFHRI